MDIGAGTRDIMLPVENIKEDNFPLFIMKSPMLIYAHKFDEFEGNEVFFDGWTIGGGLLTKKVINWARKHNGKIHGTLKALRTFTDNFNKWSDIKFYIEESPKRVDFYLDEIRIEEVLQLASFNKLKEKNLKYFVLFLQDHGYQENKSDRETRFELFLKNFIGKDIFSIFFDKPKSFLTRFVSSFEQLKEFFGKKIPIKFADASLASCIGAGICHQKKDFVAINFGNAHTILTVVKDNIITGIYEHHTFVVKENFKLFLEQISKFFNNELSSKEVFDSNGHGCFTLDKINPDKIFITGPNANIVEKNKDLIKNYNFNFEISYPFGNKMIPSLYLGYNFVRGVLNEH